MRQEPQFGRFTGKRIAPWIETMGRVLVFFWCDWRKDCRQMREILDRHYRGLINPAFPDITFVWVDADERKDLCQELSVTRFPTVLFFENGQESARFTCLSSREGILNLMHYWLGQGQESPATEGCC